MFVLQNLLFAELRLLLNYFTYLIILLPASQSISISDRATFDESAVFVHTGSICGRKISLLAVVSEVS